MQSGSMGALGRMSLSMVVATRTPAIWQLRGESCQQTMECNQLVGRPRCHRAAGSPCTACQRGCHGPASTRRSWAACRGAAPESPALHCGLKMEGQDVSKCSGRILGRCTRARPCKRNKPNGLHECMLWLCMVPASPPMGRQLKPQQGGGRTLVAPQYAAQAIVLQERFGHVGPKAHACDTGEGGLQLLTVARWQWWSPCKASANRWGWLQMHAVAWGCVAAHACCNHAGGQQLRQTSQATIPAWPRLSAQSHPHPLGALPTALPLRCLGRSCG